MLESSRSSAAVLEEYDRFDGYARGRGEDDKGLPGNIHLWLLDNISRWDEPQVDWSESRSGISPRCGDRSHKLCEKEGYERDLLTEVPAQVRVLFEAYRTREILKEMYGLWKSYRLKIDGEIADANRCGRFVQAGKFKQYIHAPEMFVREQLEALPPRHWDLFVEQYGMTPVIGLWHSQDNAPYGAVSNSPYIEGWQQEGCFDRLRREKDQIFKGAFRFDDGTLLDCGRISGGNPGGRLVLENDRVVLGNDDVILDIDAGAITRGGTQRVKRRGLSRFSALIRRDSSEVSIPARVTFYMEDDADKFCQEALRFAKAMESRASWHYTKQGEAVMRSVVGEEWMSPRGRYCRHNPRTVYSFIVGFGDSGVDKLCVEEEVATAAAELVDAHSAMVRDIASIRNSIGEGEVGALLEDFASAAKSLRTMMDIEV
jgi:hypothetical protein